MTGRRYKIVESVGNRVEEVFRYEDLAKHHPSAGREPNREYETINGQLEEVRYVGGRTLIKKDFVLLVDGSNQSVPVPSPLAGYAKTNRPYGTLQIYDAPSNGQLLGQILHLHPAFKVNDGDAVTYGQHVGLQAGTDRMGGQRYAIRGMWASAPNASTAAFCWIPRSPATATAATNSAPAAAAMA